MSFDWNNAAENAIAGALGMVPEVGSLLGALVYIFWPKSGEDIWGEIEAQVEQLVDQKIDQLVYRQVQDDLSGLKNASDDYTAAIGTGDAANISSQWITTSTLYDASLPHFQSEGYEVLLLPLFAQFANLNLSLLRDGVLFGGQWGWNESYLQETAQKLTDNIGDFVGYAEQFYQQGYQDTVAKAPTNYHECQPFRSVNAYVRQMTLGVLDFTELWPYYDPSKYPNPVTVELSREIYSDPVGTCDDSGAINLPTPPTQPISQVSVWAWDRIDAVQLTYPSGGGPGGVTQTPRMGDQGGGSNQPPHGGVFEVAGNPVTVASGLAGDILNAFTFTFKDGTSSGQLGGNYPGGGSFSFSYAGEILSSVHINGVSNYYGSADCAVFGFKYEQSQTPTLDILRLLYVTAPPGKGHAELAAALGSGSAVAEGMVAAAKTQGWEAERQQYWSSFAHRSRADGRRAPGAGRGVRCEDGERGLDVPGALHPPRRPMVAGLLDGGPERRRGHRVVVERLGLLGPAAGAAEAPDDGVAGGAVAAATGSDRCHTGLRAVGVLSRRPASRPAEPVFAGQRPCGVAVEVGFEQVQIGDTPPHGRALHGL